MNRTYQEYREDSARGGVWPIAKERCYEDGKKEMAKAILFLINQEETLDTIRSALSNAVRH